MTTTSTPPAITVEGLHVSYGATVAVDDVSFTVAPGEILGVLGPNGAGKTTTVETLTGLRRADRGHLDVLGHDPLTLVLTISALLGLGLFVAADTPTSKVAGAVGTVLFFPADGRGRSVGATGVNADDGARDLRLVPARRGEPPDVHHPGGPRSPCPRLVALAAYAVVLWLLAVHLFRWS